MSHDHTYVGVCAYKPLRIQSARRVEGRVCVYIPNDIEKYREFRVLGWSAGYVYIYIYMECRVCVYIPNDIERYREFRVLGWSAGYVYIYTLYIPTPNDMWSAGYVYIYIVGC